MSSVWLIAQRELSAFFDSLVAYIVLLAFLGFSGFFTWMYGADIFLRKEADLQVFFSVAQWTLLFFIPAITMGALAEEKQTGTIELLLTKAVDDYQVVLGKFLSSFILVVLALVGTLVYYYTVSTLGNMDHGATLCGYLGLLLMSAAYIGIGLFASSLTSNQIVAFLLALLISITFYLLFGMLAQNMTGTAGEVLDYLSIRTHFESISRGVIDSKDLIYFLSLAFLGLYLTVWNISNRK